MRKILGYVFLLSVVAVPACLAQFEVGALGGYTFPKDLTVKNATGSAAAGFKSGAAWGLFVGHNTYNYLSGEVRYTYLFSDLKLSRSGTEVTFPATTQLVHYDILLHAKKRESKVRPFLAVGGGVKIFHATGTERAFQPLSDFAALSRTNEVKPLISAGGGVKYKLNSRFTLRGEFRDYISPTPDKLIAPAPGATLGSWVHDFVPLVGLSITF
jgi:hypothetical protein